MKKAKLKDKIKRGAIKVYPLLNALSPLVDLALCLWLSKKVENEKTAVQLIPLALFIWVIWKWGKGMYLCWKSKNEARIYLENNRVIPIDGKQGSGKTSLSGYFSYISGHRTYSNTPLKIRGKYVNILTDEVVALYTKIPERSVLVIDECNMFYNATFGDAKFNSKDGYKDDLFAQSIFGQCVRHFTDGNIIYCSVDTDRLPKIIRDVFSCRLQTLKQSSHEICIIGNIVLQVLYSLLDIQVHTGVRVWTVKHYEKILDTNYTADLTNDDTQFSPTITFACLQSLTNFEYDDRYMKAFYDLLPEEQDQYYKTLSLLDAKEEMMKDTEVYKLFEQRTNGFQNGDPIEIVKQAETPKL